MVSLPGGAAAAEWAWLATRQKTLLTAADVASLGQIRDAYASDPHIVAAVNALLS